jgi:hypothetical protein
MRYVRPDESIMFWAVSGGVDVSYQAAWLTDGLPGRPVRGSGGLALNAIGPTRTIGLVAAINTNVTGSITTSFGTIPAPTLGPDGINLNPWLAVAPSAWGTVTMFASGNPAIVGELYAGNSRTLERDLLVEPDFDTADVFPWEGEFSSLAPYDNGVTFRRLAGQTIVSQAGMTDIENWWLSTRRGTRPTLIVPFEDKNDAWLVVFKYRAKSLYRDPVGSATPGQVWGVSFEFLELPRYRW